MIGEIGWWLLIAGGVLAVLAALTWFGSALEIFGWLIGVVLALIVPLHWIDDLPARLWWFASRLMFVGALMVVIARFV